MPFTYLIAIAWIYVVLYMAITESSLIAGIMTFVFYCIIPLGLILYIMRSPARKRQIKEQEQIIARQRQQQQQETTERKQSKSG